MKKRINIAIAFLITITSCTSTEKKSTVPPINKQEEIIAVYKKNGIKRIGTVLRVIMDGIKYDSIQHTKEIITDTIYGIMDNVPVLDAKNQPVKTTSGTDSSIRGWLQISKDSVNWRVENKAIDSLIKN
jgi:hypothetical protein